MCTVRGACLGNGRPRVYPAERGQYVDADVGPLGHDRFRSDFEMGWCDVGGWRTDPTFAMCGALVDGAELSSFAGGPFDVRAVMAGIRPEAKDGFLLGNVPWERFPQGIVSGRPSTCCTPATRPVAPERVW